MTPPEEPRAATDLDQKMRSAFSGEHRAVIAHAPNRMPHTGRNQATNYAATVVPGQPSQVPGQTGRLPGPGAAPRARLVLNDAPHTPRTHVDRDAHLPNGRKFAMRNLQLR